MGSFSSDAIFGFTDETIMVHIVMPNISFYILLIITKLSFNRSQNNNKQSNISSHRWVWPHDVTPQSSVSSATACPSLWTCAWCTSGVRRVFCWRWGRLTCRWLSGPSAAAAAAAVPVCPWPSEFSASFFSLSLVLMREQTFLFGCRSFSVDFDYCIATR